MGTQNDYLVSTIIPNYNNAPFIEECVLSILNQSYQNVEVIIMDDASTDGSQDIIARLESKFAAVRAVYNEKNVGITQNRINGIALASGQYFNYMDSDDYIQNKDKLQSEMELILYYKEKYGTDVIAFSDVHISDGSGKIVNRFRDIRPVKEGRITSELMLRQCLIPQNFTLDRRLYYDVGGHDYSIPFYENWDLKIRLSHKYNFVFTGVPGFVYRRHGHGLSNAHLDQHKKWILKIVEKNMDLIDQDQLALIREQATAMPQIIEKELHFINQHLEAISHD